MSTDFFSWMGEELVLTASAADSRTTKQEHSQRISNFVMILKLRIGMQMMQTTCARGEVQLATQPQIA